MAPTQPHVVVFDGQIQNGFAALLRGLACPQPPAFGQLLSFRCGFQFHPSIVARKVMFFRNESTPWLACISPQQRSKRTDGATSSRPLSALSGHGRHYLFGSPSRQAITSSSPRTASSTLITGCTSNTKAGSIEQNL